MVMAYYYYSRDRYFCHCRPKVAGGGRTAELGGARNAATWKVNKSLPAT
jgi:hypothetical protein